MARDDYLGSIPLTEPWTLLPSQLTSQSDRLPEQELMLAVLREAIDEYRAMLARPASSTRPRSLALRRWFSSEDIDWPFSLRNICEALDIDRTQLRARLVAWRSDTDTMRAPGVRIRLGNRSMRGTRTKVVG